MLIILWLPILSIFSLFLLGRKIGWKGSIFLSKTIIKVLLISILILLWINKQDTIEINTNILSFSILKLEYSVTLDNKTSIILLLAVSVVSTCVHHYSENYIKHDKSKVLFISLLGIFTISIIFITFSNNLLQLFIGWEIIGITSYLLISFWSNRLNAHVSGLKAFIINRLGDMALMCLISILVWHYNELNYENLYDEYINNEWINVIVLIILISSMAKSSQLIIHNWLPTSIEGPTPVSALIHAATLVTAGVFLIVKLNILISQIFWIIGLIGSLTALLAGLIGSIQNDIKRLIAYSTISQMGYLFVSLSIINYSMTMSHIINHAYFKALLFLCAGSIIHSQIDIQDLRKYGSLIYSIPITYLIMLIGSISLIAVVSITGYYSKELIINLSQSYSLLGLIIYISLMLSAIFTGYYSIRLLKLVFCINKSNISLNILEISKSDMITKILLLLLSVVIGYIFSDYVLYISSDINLIDNELITVGLIKLIPLFITLLGSLVQYLIPINNNIFNVSLIKGLWFDQIYSQLANKILIIFNKVILNKLDLGIYELLGPTGLNGLTIWLDKNMLNNISYYAFILIISVVLGVLGLSSSIIIILIFLTF